MKKILLSAALFAFLAAPMVSSAYTGDEKDKKGEKKASCCSSKEAKSCGKDSKEAKAENTANASADKSKDKACAAGEKPGKKCCATKDGAKAEKKAI